MAEFLDYKVDLLLKDGSRSSGFISSVDSTQIVLNNKSANVIYQANLIQDLKVIQLPKKKKKKGPQTNGSGSGNCNSNGNGDGDGNGAGLLDDAIVYHKLKPKSEEIKINDIDSDIQDFNHEFDFEANLAMFDKKTVFADFHKQDNASSRLVDYNKLKPKIKYGNDEMIINSKDNWENIGKKDVPITVDIPKENDLHLRSQYGSVISATPIQLLEIERLAENFGFNQDLLNEVCATNLSKLIIRNLGDSTRLSKRDNHNLPPLVLILIGSSRCGSRALATGRHLSNHGIRVLGFVINQDDNNLQQKIKLFENSGGKIIYNKTSTLFDVINNQLDSPVELILDGLQGYDDHLDDVFYNNKSELLSLINWLNQPSQSRIIMALDLPSGIDGGSGMITNEKYLIKCKWCISMGVPITGLLLAYKNRHLENHDIIHYLIDVGIPNKVYSAKSNLRKFDKFWYCAESYMIMELSK
jgi:enhancer of mRNA-decapping protein 3